MDKWCVDSIALTAHLQKYNFLYIKKYFSQNT